MAPQGVTRSGYQGMQGRCQAGLAAKLHAGQIGCGGVHLYGETDSIDQFAGGGTAENLPPENLQGVGGEDDPAVNLRGIGHGGGVMIGQAGLADQNGEAFLLRLMLGKSGDAEGQAIDLAGVDAYRSGIVAELAQAIEVHAGDTALGRGLGGDHGVIGLAGEKVLFVGAISDSKNIGVFAGTLEGVDPYPAGATEGQTHISGQSDLGAGADGDEHCVHRQRFLLGDLYLSDALAAGIR